MEKQHEITGKIVDVVNQKIYGATIFVDGNRIHSIEPNEKANGPYILPGLIDSHIHIESSMLTPQYFAREAVKHGTIGTVSDPHEIANVLGEKGINAMIEDAQKVSFKFFFGVPSCVPATPFETSGAVLDSKIVQKLIEREDFYYLAEMMNFPGVINQDPEVMKKIKTSLESGKPVDGHVPGLTGSDLDKYINAGITTDHECGNYEEAVEKINKGMKIQLREGSAAKDFDSLYKLIDEFPDHVMLCSDDKHPDDLIQGHINKLIKKGLEKGLDLFNLLKAAVINPAKHYHLPAGMLQVNDPADFILVDNFDDFNVSQTYINGEKVFDEEGSHISPVFNNYPNVMHAKELSVPDIEIEDKQKPVKVINAKDRTLYTTFESFLLNPVNGKLHSNPQNDILKIVVQNRYKSQQPSIGFIRNFGLQRGAIATSVAHDSHNIICVGVEDEAIVKAINEIIHIGGGNIVYDGNNITSLPLEFGGLMTSKPARDVAEQYQKLNTVTKQLGCSLYAPFMTLAFMALPVIPELKITDQGLFDVTQFKYTELYDE
ncbi:MAG: adenine deaminase [Bacteroidota bacterium]